MVEQAKIGSSNNNWLENNLEEIRQWDGEEHVNDVVKLLNSELASVQMLAMKYLIDYLDRVDAEFLFQAMVESDESIADQIWNLLGKSKIRESCLK